MQLNASVQPSHVTLPHVNRQGRRPPPQARRQWAPLLAIALAVALAVALVGCASSAGTGGATATATTSAPTATATATLPAATAAPTTASGPYPVHVYFSKHPDSDNDPTKVFAVNRLSPTLMVATYSIQQLIAGPTGSEQAAGYYTELVGALSGASNCGGADFTITLNHRGTTPQTGAATLQFCRTVSLAGDLTGARISAEIDAILTQFPSTQQVVILTSAGSCFDDLSGQNLCLSA